MKVKALFLLHVPPPVHGAALRNLSLAESELLRNTFDIKLLPLNFVDTVADIGKVSILKFWRLLKFICRLIVALFYFRPKFIYFTISPVGNAFYRDVLIVLIIKLFRLPLVYHLRSLGIKDKYHLGINHYLYDFAFRGTFLICLSKSHKQDVKDLPCRRIFVVPNGIKVEVQPLEFILRQRPQILFLSNYFISKGVLDFLEALKILRDRNLSFQSKLVGSSGDLNIEYLCNLVRTMGLQDLVEVNDGKFGPDKFLAILNSDIFVLPTFYELFPGVILEAMQCGKPVVSTNTGAIPEIIDDGLNGFLVPTHNPDEVANKIELLLRKPELRKLVGENAYKKFLNNYTFERFEKNIKDVFEEIVRAANLK